MADSQQLISLLRQKDAKALSMLYDDYGDTLYGVAYKILGRQDYAQDAVQEAFVKIWNKSEHFDPDKASLFTWILNITRNTAIDLRRKMLARGVHEIRSANEYVYLPNEAISDEKSQELQRGLKNLDPKYRVVIDLLYFGGCTQEEAREILDIPLGTVKTRVKIALRELRKAFTNILLI